ncbi:DUF3574 domain-containing protein [Pseudomonas sp. 7P_10.2_Bac1]|uniref:DUF3574 domain-containing protein n=1 Tax=Pseudomonas sp. 7P_10.2_Bac1 TaxID=2971614 RepID=UPI0021C5A946|nr:DUF3574 domain-containing protein [Pseudomonas sp. 7P_10.2_Bac1]MCU1726133.1 DUF3574 domain-containing protein [Pseudomonas sp. 7P_10.2_Bac1]
MKKWSIFTLLLAVAVLVAFGIAREQKPSPSEAYGRSMVRSELYFAAVDREAWDAFLSEEVTPRFPDGLSWYTVHGQWRGPSGQPEKLPSRIMLLIHADNSANREALATIGQLFQERFGYAVLQVVNPVRASDPDWTAKRLDDNRQLSQ